MSELYHLGYVIGDKTSHEGIFEVKNSTIYEYNNEKLTSEKYWSFHFSEAAVSQSAKSLSLELNDLLVKSIKKRIKSFNKIVVPLSGGLGFSSSFSDS